jgi:hypothetical protein
MAKVRFRCPECDKKLSATERDFGRQGECPRCNAHFEVSAELLEDAGAEAEVLWAKAGGGEGKGSGAEAAGAFELESFEEEKKETAQEAPPPPPVQPAEPFIEEALSEEPLPQADFAAAAGAPWVGQVPKGPPDYPLLRFVSACFKVIGGIALVLATLGFLAAMVLAVTGRWEQAPVLGMLTLTGAVFIAGALVFAVGELLVLLPDIRAEVWRQTELLRAILRKLPEDKPRR